MSAAAVEFLRLVAGGAEGWLSIFDLDEQTHHPFHTLHSEQAAAAAMEISSRGNQVYVRNNVQGGRGGTKAATVSVFTGVSLDFDVKGPAHKAEDLPESVEDAARLVASAGVPEPTLDMHTGGGLLLYWALAEPIHLTTSEAHQRATNLLRDFQRYIRTVARKEFDWHVDSTPDLGRLQRIPGTRNWKEAYGPDGAPVAVRSWNGRRLSIGELEGIASRAVSRQVQVRGRQVALPGAEGKLASWPAIEAGCRVLAKWASIADGLPEPAWYALASVVGRCEDGASIFQALSKEDSRYREDEASSKLAHAIEASPPRLCASIADLSGECASCPFKGQINSPIALGYADPAAVNLARQWVYVAEQDGFVELAAVEGRS